MNQPTKPLDRAALQRGKVSAVARKLLQEAVNDCAANEGTLWLLSADGQRMEGALNKGPTQQVIENIAVPVGDSVVGMVAATGMATSIGPGDVHNPTVDQKTGLKTEAMIAAPVHLGGNVIGVISAINPRGGGLFSPDSLRTLEWKAYLMGLILGDSDAR